MQASQGIYTSSLMELSGTLSKLLNWLGRIGTSARFTRSVSEVGPALSWSRTVPRLAKATSASFTSWKRSKRRSLSHFRRITSTIWVLRMPRSLMQINRFSTSYQMALISLTGMNSNSWIFCQISLLKPPTLRLHTSTLILRQRQLRLWSLLVAANSKVLPWITWQPTRQCKERAI